MILQIKTNRIVFFLSTLLLAKTSPSNMRRITLTQFHISVSQNVWESFSTSKNPFAGFLEGSYSFRVEKKMFEMLNVHWFILVTP